MKNQLRQTQVISSFGPGSMIDLPDTSVMIAGLDYWHYTSDDQRQSIIQEPRLVARLTARFGVPNIELRRPPTGCDDPKELQNSIHAWRFPRWFVAAADQRTEGGFVERRLVHRRELTNGKFYLNNKQVSIIPIRFVRACPRGHIDDIDWNTLVHGTQTDCRRPKWMVERGNAGDLDEVVVKCECGSQVRMSEAADRSRRLLGVCDGSRPWLGPRSREGCGIPSQLLIRSASNAYFPERQTLISIPATSGGADRRVQRVVHELVRIENDRIGLKYRRMDQPLRDALEGLSDDEVWQAYDRIKAGGVPAVRSLKEEEFEALASSPAEFGADVPETDFHACALPKDQWQAPWMDGVRQVILVHRLRAVSALLGFTRFESSSADIHGELDADVKTATLAREVSWLPASETRGEGVFIEFEPGMIADWLKRHEVQSRMEILVAGFQEWKKEHEGSGRKFAGMPYIMLHSLSHLLLNAISLECGYSASSLQERVYAIDGGDGPGQYGILIYTSATDAQGTLGGLVEAGRAIRRHMRRALESAMLCSNDPVCAQHAPTAPGTAQLHGAACHGCLLVPETSCEQRNDFLDRALVVPTVEHSGTAFFEAVT